MVHRTYQYSLPQIDFDPKPPPGILPGLRRMSHLEASEKISRLALEDARGKLEVISAGYAEPGPFSRLDIETPEFSHGYASFWTFFIAFIKDEVSTQELRELGHRTRCDWSHRRKWIEGRLPRRRDETQQFARMVMTRISYLAAVAFPLAMHLRDDRFAERVLRTGQRLMRKTVRHPVGRLSGGIGVPLDTRDRHTERVIFVLFYDAVSMVWAKQQWGLETKSLTKGKGDQDELSNATSSDNEPDAASTP